MIGRRTLPILYPKFARYTVIVPLLIWSAVLWHVWKVDIYLASAFLGLAAYTGYRYLTLTTVKQDKVSYYWYNVSLYILALWFMLNNTSFSFGFPLLTRFRGTIATFITEDFLRISVPFFRFYNKSVVRSPPRSLDNLLVVVYISFSNAYGSLYTYPIVHQQICMLYNKQYLPFIAS